LTVAAGTTHLASRCPNQPRPGPRPVRRKTGAVGSSFHRRAGLLAHGTRCCSSSPRNDLLGSVNYWTDAVHQASGHGALTRSRKTGRRQAGGQQFPSTLGGSFSRTARRVSSERAPAISAPATNHSRSDVFRQDLAAGPWSVSDHRHGAQGNRQLPIRRR